MKRKGKREQKKERQRIENINRINEREREKGNRN